MSGALQRCRGFLAVTRTGGRASDEQVPRGLSSRCRRSPRTICAARLRRRPSAPGPTCGAADARAAKASITLDNYADLFDTNLDAVAAELDAAIKAAAAQDDPASISGATAGRVRAETPPASSPAHTTGCHTRAAPTHHRARCTCGLRQCIMVGPPAKTSRHGWCKRLARALVPNVR
jgi:hypothetical protein